MNFRLLLLFTILLVLLGSPAVTSAQSKEITEAEYWAGIRSGFAATRKDFPRRETTTNEGFADEKATYSRKETHEYEASDKYYSIEETSMNGKLQTEEATQIGAVRYCRVNLAEWKRSGCYLSPPAPLGSATETRYSVESTGDITKYRRVAISIETSNGEPIKFLTEDLFIMNANQTVRERTIIKSYYDSKSVRFRTTQKYEYGIKLKPIEEPIP